jgi:hypothetical protein
MILMAFGYLQIIVKICPSIDKVGLVQLNAHLC